MHIDWTLHDLPDHLAYDVLIIGSGPAGCAVAHTLVGSGIRCAVVESGLEKPDAFSDSLRATAFRGIHIKDHSRERVLGGASTTWSGISSPLDPIDFEKRPYVPHSGWPIGVNDITPYYEKAAATFGFAPLALFHSDDWMSPPTTFTWKALEEKIFIATDPPRHFGTWIREAAVSDRLDLITGATATAITGDGATGAARGVRIQGRHRRAATIAGRHIVLACGGIENPRLLLHSGFACKAGLGNDHDQVGRYFMNHPKHNRGQVRPFRQAVEHPGYFGFLSVENAYATYKGLRLRDAYQRKHQLLNSYIRFEPDPAAQAGAASLSDRINKAASALGLARRYSTRTFAIRNFMEMAPRPENRITLSDRTDPFGVPLPLITHALSDLDKRSLTTLHRVLQAEGPASGLGTVQTDLHEQLDPWPIDLDASHHMGATRMGTDPATSVVSPQCRLHSCPNVYVAGSSVFPTSGSANPTFTLVALALRLGDHLRQQIHSR